MLEKYRDKQSLFYEEVMNSVKNHKISHAYLIETNNYSMSDDLILNFVKFLFCQTIDSNLESNEKICNLIDNGAFSDFMIVDTDGAWIKKEQILEIKEKFKTTSYENGPRIYLIRNADKLNKYAANSLLKFLEEPDGNIIAILEVDNRYKILETIRSRCQIYSLVNHDDNKNIENINLVTDIIKLLEDKKNKSIAYLPIVLENDYRNKDFWNKTFNDMIYIYESAIRKYENIDFFDYGKILDLVISNNSLDSIIRKINVLFEVQNDLNYNLNVTMMLDLFIIKFNGGD